MPKEVIYGKPDVSDPDDPRVCVTQVTWSKDHGHVELATTLVIPSTHEYIKREVVGGWWTQLERSDINQMIRVLRRARDQAFGSDE